MNDLSNKFNHMINKQNECMHNCKTFVDQVLNSNNKEVMKTLRSKFNKRIIDLNRRLVTIILSKEKMMIDLTLIQYKQLYDLNMDTKNCLIEQCRRLEDHGLDP